MRRITTIFGLMLLLWLGASPVAAFTRAQSKAASMVTSLQAGHDFPLAAPELLAAFIVMQPKTALREGGAGKSHFTWEMTLVIHYKHKGYPVHIARITLGAVVAMDFSAAISQTFDLDGTRRPRVINTTDANSSFSESYGYDMQSRRIRRETATETLVYAHHGSRVIAMGTRDVDGIITWTHAFGHGPLGPAFQKDLTDSGHDLFIFTDHLGTPFAWRNPVTDATSFTPFNPWGELLATHPDRGPPWETQGQVTTNGFTLPTDAVLPLPPMGLAGHLYDTDTGLVQMHHRSYSPRLGQFLTPDYRTPNIYDPSTFTEPYAYAAGNPMLYWDPDGLEEKPGSIRNFITDTKEDIERFIRILNWFNKKNSNTSSKRASQALAISMGAGHAPFALAEDTLASADKTLEIAGAGLEYFITLSFLPAAHEASKNGNSEPLNFLQNELDQTHSSFLDSSYQTTKSSIDSLAFIAFNQEQVLNDLGGEIQGTLENLADGNIETIFNISSGASQVALAAIGGEAIVLLRAQNGLKLGSSLSVNNLLSRSILVRHEKDLFLVNKTSDFISNKRKIGLSSKSPLFYSVPNANGGRVWVSVEDIDFYDFNQLVDPKKARMPITILTGTHGNEIGRLIADRHFYAMDNRDFGHLANVNVIDIHSINNVQLSNILNQKSRIICAWCFSERSNKINIQLNFE